MRIKLFEEFNPGQLKSTSDEFRDIWREMEDDFDVTLDFDSYVELTSGDHRGSGIKPTSNIHVVSINPIISSKSPHLNQPIGDFVKKVMNLIQFTESFLQIEFTNFKIYAWGTHHTNVVEEIEDLIFSNSIFSNIVIYFREKIQPISEGINEGDITDQLKDIWSDIEDLDVDIKEIDVYNASGYDRAKVVLALLNGGT